MHCVERVIDLIQFKCVRHKLIYFKSLVHVSLNQLRYAISTLPTYQYTKVYLLRITLLLVKL